MPSRTGEQVASLQMNLPVFDPLMHAGVLGVELGAVDEGAGEQVGIARLVHPDLAHHLADDNLDVLVVDVNALHPVGALDFHG